MTHSEISLLEARVSRLENMLLNFAAMVVGSPGELERVVSTIEARKAQEFVVPALNIDPEKRSKAMHKIARLVMGNSQVSHSDVVREVQSILKAKQITALMAELASKGEIKIIKVAAAQGKPTTYYEHIARRPQIT